METFENFDFTSKCGEKLAAVKMAPKTPVAAIVHIHGMGEHAGRYAHWAERFKKHGIAWYSFDLPGHGKSTGKRGHFRSMGWVMSIIQEFEKAVKTEVKAAPMILYGHSMGGNLVLNYLLRNTHQFKLGIVTSPWIRLVHPPSPAMIQLADIMHLIYPGFTQSSGLKAEDMSTQHEECHLYAKDPLNHKKISANSFHIVHHGGLFIEKNIHQLSIPLFLTHSEQDPLTLFAATAKLREQNAGQIDFLKFEQGKHELHNDSTRDELFAAEIQFIQSKLHDRVQDKA